LQRQIVDPCLGTRWQLVPNALHPEQPGRLILADSTIIRPLKPDSGATPASSPVIRAGDRVTVFQSTSVLRARLAAVALESAAAGQTMRVRLLAGTETRNGSQGTVVDVRAIAVGEASWLGVHRTSP
jgi:hypothetical protein